VAENISFLDRKKPLEEMATKTIVEPIEEPKTELNEVESTDEEKINLDDIPF
jgi:hypothetical protein